MRHECGHAVAERWPDAAFSTSDEPAVVGGSATSGRRSLPHCGRCA